jgi:hypothetical protein
MVVDEDFYLHALTQNKRIWKPRIRGYTYLQLRMIMEQVMEIFLWVLIF